MEEKNTLEQKLTFAILLGDENKAEERAKEIFGEEWQGHLANIKQSYKDACKETKTLFRFYALRKIISAEKRLNPRAQ